MTRRVFLLGIFDWLFFGGRHVTLSGIQFRQIRKNERQSKRRYLLIHGNEETARHVLTDHMKRHNGVAYLVTGHERNARIQGGVVDPNRIFSREGALRSLRNLNPNWTAEGIERVAGYLDRERPKLLAALLPPPGGLLVATHNNSRGYSVKDEIPISDRTSIKDADHPHEFFLCTDPADFNRLGVSPYNVVLQNRPGGEDDGSLSRLAAKLRVRYVNIEAGLGKAREQRQMLEWLEANLH